MLDQNIDELSKAVECHEKHQKYHVFFDPIAEYMEDFFNPVLQFHFHYEDQIHSKLPWSSQYHVYFGFKCNQEVQMSDKINDWLHWKFHVV